MRTINSQEDVDKRNYCKEIVKNTSPKESDPLKLLKYSLAKDFIKYPELMHYWWYDYMVKL